MLENERENLRNLQPDSPPITPAIKIDNNDKKPSPEATPGLIPTTLGSNHLNHSSLVKIKIKKMKIKIKTDKLSSLICLNHPKYIGEIDTPEEMDDNKKIKQDKMEEEIEEGREEKKTTKKKKLKK